MQFSPPTPFTARFEEKIIHNSKYVEYHFEMENPHRFEFLAGQYVSLKIADTGERRSYSICSAPSIDHGFELLVDISPAGKGAQFLESLEFGQRVEGLGPLGHFVLSEQSESAIVLVGTGSGIAPLKSMLLELQEKRPNELPITLYWGMRYAEDLFWLEDFQDIVESSSTFSFYPVISQPVPEWTLSTGRVTDLLAIHTHPPDAGYYLCGSKEITESLQDFLLAKSVESQYIHHEKFF